MFRSNLFFMANPIWIMTSAFDQLSLEGTIEKALQIGVQGLDLCVFRKDGTRNDFVATHLDYQNFGSAEAQNLLCLFNQAHLRLSIGAFDNLIGGDHVHHIVSLRLGNWLDFLGDITDSRRFN